MANLLDEVWATFMPCSSSALMATMRCSGSLVSASPRWARAAESVRAHAEPARTRPAVRALPCAPAYRPPEPWPQRAAPAGPRRGEEFADRFAGRVAGLVVHDEREMAAQTDRLLAALRELNARLCERPDGPLVFLEYAAGLDRGWFVEVAERLQAAERVGCCLDVGHIGLRQAAARFGDGHPGLNLKKLSPVDDRLPDLVADVQDAVGSALPHVLEVTRSLARLGKHLHFHLHDGHPLIPGLRDHFASSRGCQFLQLPRLADHWT